MERAYSLSEAAQVLGVSESTVRRRVQSGELRSDRLERPQGSAWRVYLPPEAPGTLERELAPLVAELAFLREQLQLQQVVLGGVAQVTWDLVLQLAPQLGFPPDDLPERRPKMQALMAAWRDINQRRRKREALEHPSVKGPKARPAGPRARPAA